MYRIGYPFWKTMARLGFAMKVRVEVVEDTEARVFVATSDDLRGLVCEASSIEELIKEVNLAMSDLLEMELHQPTIRKPITDLRICPA